MFGKNNEERIYKLECGFDNIGRDNYWRDKHKEDLVKKVKDLSTTVDLLLQHLNLTVVEKPAKTVLETKGGPEE